MREILIIDDKQDLCLLMKRMLSKENFQDDCVHTLLEAGKKLETRPAVIFLDNNPPDGQGPEYIHMHPQAFVESRIILISADPSPDIRLQAKKEGLIAFLQKPFTSLTVHELIKTVA